MNKLRQWTTFALTPLWRWKWLLLVLLTITIGYGLFAVKSRFSSRTYPTEITDRPGGWFGPELCVEHGWPFSYSYRFRERKSPLMRWTIWTDVYSFAWGYFFLNIAIAIGVCGGITYLADWRFRRWQLRLADVLAILLLIAVLLSFAFRIESNYQADYAYLNELSEKNIDLYYQDEDSPLWYARPLRDLGLVSAGALCPFSFDTHYVFVSENCRQRDPNVNQLLLREVELGRRLRSDLDCLSIADESLTDEGMTALTRWAPSCRSLVIQPDDSLTDHATATLVDAWPQLEELEIGWPHLTAESLRSIGKLKALNRLWIPDGSPDLQADDLQPLEELPNLATLGIPSSLFERLTRQERQAWRNRDVLLYDVENCASAWDEPEEELEDK